MGAMGTVYLSVLLAPCKLSILAFGFGPCDIYKGPVQTMCHTVTHQWDSCITTAYMQTFTLGERHCMLRYCNSHCMAEKHGKPTRYVGPVYDDCACNPDVNLTTTEPNVILPKWCHSPDGTNCNWFSTCLERVQPCIADIKNEHAVEYAKHFCDLYNRNKHHFRDKTRQWMNSVRRCLLVRLVPLIRPFFNHTNCQQIDSFAVVTQLRCHLKPYKYEPSVCDLNLEEWAKVFWTIKGNLTKSASVGLKIMLESTSKCGSSMLQSILGDTSTGIIQNIQQTGMFLVRLTVTGDDDNGTVATVVKDYDEAAESIINQLAVQLHWDQNGLLWFAFINNRSNVNEVGVNILFGSRSMYDVTAVGVKVARMNEILIDMVVALSSEKISLNMADGFNVTKFNACLDFGCQATAYDIFPKLKQVVSVADFSPPDSLNVLIIALYTTLSKFY